MEAPALSIIIVSFNTSEALDRCLTSLGTRHEVIVVDNDSRDDSVQMVRSRHPHVVLIQNAANLGFGRACNQGLEASQAGVSLLLNSDCVAVDGAIDKLFEIRNLKGAVGAGGRLLNLDGSLQQSCSNQLTLWAVLCEQLYLERLFPNSRWFSPYWISDRIDQTTDVEQVMGACLMVPSTARFDERFLLYCEDTELCYRLRKMGEIIYVPEAEFFHELGSSSTGARWKSVALYNRGKELYFRIHFGPIHAFACWLLNRIGAILRALAWGFATVLSLGVVRKYRRQFATFVRVAFAPISGPQL